MRARLTLAAGTAALALAGSVFAASPALAQTATQSITAGTLAFVSAPGNPTLGAVALTGVDQTATGTMPMDVSDATGGGLGWNITLTSTTFTAGTHSLSTGATTVPSAPGAACDAATTCTVATPAALSYPYTVPAGTTAPLATKVFNASLNTGMGNQTVSPTFHVAVPANTYAGSYVSTWTVSLQSAP